MDNSIPRRQCLDCKEFFPPTSDYFHKSPRGRDGLASYCKSCAHARTKRNKQKPEEQIKEQQRRKRWYQANKEKQAEARKQWYEANREYALEKDRQFRKEHPEILAARWQRWYQTDNGKEHSRIRVRSRNGRKKSAEGNYTYDDIQRKLEAQKGKCYWCHCKLDKWHIDHIVPLARGGTNWPDNLVIACPPCNLKRNKKLPHEWPEGGRLL